MLINIDEPKILKTESLNNLFKSASLKGINENCKILHTDFYLDSFNYFPITTKNESFENIFKREDDNSISHFYTEDFYKNFTDKKSDFKLIKDSVILGSSPSDNYFSNLIHFLPRIFFINDKKINLIIHRNLSNKFRSFIEKICLLRGIQISFTFLDDGFYKFNNSSIPEFFNINKSIKVLKFFLEQFLTNIQVPEFKSKVYIRREDANYRKILNENDLIIRLKKQEFDNNAMFRRDKVSELRDKTQEDEKEVYASDRGLNYVSLDGNIGNIINGAGLAMASMDMIKLAGGEPANFLDVGGGATPEKIVKAFKLITMDKKVKVILVNIFAGINRCDWVAEGIVQALEKIEINVPLVIRLAGTNVEKGNKILQDSKLDYIEADTLEDAANKAVAALK